MVQNLSNRIESFTDAFDGRSGGCRRTCNCGKIFYNPDPDWDFEEGELEELENIGFTLDFAVPVVVFEGSEYVSVCDCWHKRAEKIMGFLDSHSHQLVKYFELEKKRKQFEADHSPVVDG